MKIHSRTQAIAMFAVVAFLSLFARAPLAAPGAIILRIPDPVQSIFYLFGAKVGYEGGQIFATSFPAEGGGGFVTIFDRATGNVVHTLSAPNLTMVGYFGTDIVVNTKWITVAGDYDVPNSDDHRQVVYVFDRQTFALARELRNPRIPINDTFGGGQIFLSDDLLLVPAGDDIGITDAGSSYLFDLQSGNLIHTFDNPDPQYIAEGFRSEFFGHAELVGSYIGIYERAIQNGIQPGVVHLYDKIDYAYLRTIQSPLPVDRGSFGSGRVALNGVLYLSMADSNPAVSDRGMIFGYSPDGAALRDAIPGSITSFEGKFGTVKQVGNNLAVAESFLVSGDTFTVTRRIQIIDPIDKKSLLTINPQTDVLTTNGFAVVGNDILVGRVPASHSPDLGDVVVFEGISGVSASDVRAYLLGYGLDATGLDRSGDQIVDIADMASMAP